jgi:predicted nucleic acid-binding protein
MKTYWDSSALVETYNEPELGMRLRKEGGVTRPHTLAEFFSTLTGGRLGIKTTAEEAAALAREMAEKMEFVNLNENDVLSALKRARKAGVRGGRIHDFLHAVAAEKAGAKKLLTMDRNDFEELTDLEIEQV